MTAPHLAPMKFKREAAEADPLIAIAGGGVNCSTRREMRGGQIISRSPASFVEWQLPNEITPPEDLVLILIRALDGLAAYKASSDYAVAGYSRMALA